MIDKKTIIIMFSIILLVNPFRYFLGNINQFIKKPNQLKTVEKQLLQEENKALKKQIKFLADDSAINVPNYKMQRTNIIFRPIATFYQEIIVMAGKKEGLKVNDAVLSEEGLVGFISYVKNNSRVQLLTSSQAKVSIKVDNSFGILQKYDPLTNLFLLSNINNQEKINIGSIVYTSGLNTIPGNVKVGYVDKIIEAQDIEKKVYIKSFVNFDKLNYLLVYTKDKVE